MMSVAPPDAASELRVTTLHATRGINFWSQRPVVRLDLTVGAYDHISSADVPHFTDALLAVLPGLDNHHCSIGRRGGFVIRLRRGTYAAHIVEHVALELQSVIGHKVGYGRTRGGDSPGEYTIVFEHRHEQVGLRAAALALEVVQRAFCGTLETVEPALHELRALAATADTPPLYQRVVCGVTGGSARGETQEELVRRLGSPEDKPLVIDVSPAYLLQAGLPYARSDIAIILDAELNDVPERYRAPDNARRLVSILADAVPRGGFVICPAREWEVQEYAREQDCSVAVFAADDDVTGRDQRVAAAVGRVCDERIWLDRCDSPVDAGPLRPDAPRAAQVAAALAEYVLRAEPGSPADV